jgi:hypothetical protein
MKALSVIQMFFGALSGADACYLGYIKAGIIHQEPGTVFSLPPNAILEYVLLGCGVVILGCAIFQMKSRIKLSGWQTLLGAVITLGALFFSVRAATLGHGEVSALYYTVYGFLALGIAVVILALVQLFKGYSKQSI